MYNGRDCLLRFALFFVTNSGIRELLRGFQEHKALHDCLPQVQVLEDEHPSGRVLTYQKKK